MRCEIDGAWTADEMGTAFLHLRDLYMLQFVLQIEADMYRDLRHGFPPAVPETSLFYWRMTRLGLTSLGFPGLSLDPGRLAEWTIRAFPSEQLAVKRIEYGSPGFTDFAGLGQIMGHVKEFVTKVLEMRSNRRQRELENQEREQKILQLRIENAQRFVHLAKECGYSDAEIRPLIHWVDDRQETFLRLAQAEKLKSVEMLPKPHEKGH